MPIPPQIKTVKLKTWEEIHPFSKLSWLFRGHGEWDWDLDTTLDRCCSREQVEPKDRARFEQALIREFQRAYHHYDHRAPDRAHTVEWLSLMQHHGAPTRLLDFSYSIYVAAHFAIETAKGDSAIWAISRDWLADELKRNCKGKKKRLAVKFCDSNFNEDREAVVEKLFFKSPHSPAVAPVNPFHLNQRLRAQKGAFLMQGTVKKTLTANLSALKDLKKKGNIVRIVIPLGLRDEVQRALVHMNISNATLFPDLDGFAKSLGSNPLLSHPNGKKPPNLGLHRGTVHSSCPFCKCKFPYNQTQG